MKRIVSIVIVILVPWILLTGFELTEIALGAVVSFILAVVIADKLNFEFNLKSLPKLFIFVFAYIPRFILELIKANIDVAKRVLNPSLPINPGFIKIPTSIKSEYGKLTLANSITLTPGTLSLDMDENFIYIHWIDVKGETIKERQTQVSGVFEKILRRVFS
jgi:multicomponent Na+:H+ antiporter subunit E